jgi:hypothetical protein
MAAFVWHNVKCTHHITLQTTAQLPGLDIFSYSTLLGCFMKGSLADVKKGDNLNKSIPFAYALCYALCLCSWYLVRADLSADVVL